MSEPSLISFVENKAMAARLADVIEAQLARAIAEKGAASFAVSGGSTPAALYDALSERDLHWEKVRVLLVDERWVAPGEAGSNETFVRDTLINNKAAGATLHGLWREGMAPATAADALNSELSDLFSACDAVVLGMGNDGHTASWFPHAEGLDAALSSDALVAAVRAAPSDVVGAHRDRVTMTLPAVARARFVCLLMAGAEKRKTFEAVRAPGPVEDHPVRAILKTRPDLWACWAA